MSLEQIKSSVILEIEQLIKNGATYKEIKEKTGVSDGTIAKVKQGKITSARVYNPICANREEELSVLVNHKNKQLEKLKHLYIQEEETSKNLRNKLETKNEEIDFWKTECEKYKHLYKEKEFHYDKLKSDFKALTDNQHNISSVDDKNELKKANKRLNDNISTSNMNWF